MMVLILGGSGSGKSAYAEETASLLAQTDGMDGGMKKYYLATMQVFDGEGRRKVERHRALRSGKGFQTIEQPTGIAGALEKMEAGGRTVLLECISNLAANEMFTEEGIRTEEQVAQAVVRDIKLLKEQTTHLIVVSNNVFEDGIAYDGTTMAYIRALGEVNRQLAALADRAAEVVAGIPLMIK